MKWTACPQALMLVSIHELTAIISSSSLLALFASDLLMSEGLQLSAHLTEMLLPGAQESLGAVTGWVFYCFKVRDWEGRGGSIISYF